VDETLPSAHGGWLAGLRDPVVGQALAALHGEPKKLAGQAPATWRREADNRM